ncbi:hypothetical protein NEOLI_004102 [Neolecta irregularis DAH-3]|uniref:Uncharacterized protein n=1 Tax=Neolecta irregularis (strain DAH-3) TaxID=1198029 RepID=A0A1U7LSJ6_NEOID|nr:hypothetical protein NEOLI_004102 [Neolecta irregularis DAH-3]|eukprot:OLL25491.1 hypothetical protein NEOLI_004102 [Neolecta irregularis DAH-3]
MYLQHPVLFSILEPGGSFFSDFGLSFLYLVYCLLSIQPLQAEFQVWRSRQSHIVHSLSFLDSVFSSLVLL